MSWSGGISTEGIFFFGDLLTGIASKTEFDFFFYKLPCLTQGRQKKILVSFLFEPLMLRRKEEEGKEEEESEGRMKKKAME